MIISLIAAMGKNRVIGKDNQMMWHLPLEYKHFKETTMGHCIITGRKNFEATGRPLPGRTNIVVTRSKDFQAQGVVVVHSLDEALNHAKTLGETEAFVIGGGQIYSQALSYADKIYLTEVDYNEEGDVYFPDFDTNLYLKEKLHFEPVGEKNSKEWTAFLYRRNAL